MNMSIKLNSKRSVRRASNCGFTLMETLVGITLLASVVIGPVTFLTTGFTNIKTAEDRLTGLYLAQEGLEFVRAIRDYNVITGNINWRAGLTANTYKMDFDDPGLSFYVVSGGQPLLYNDATGIYSYNNGVESKFRRWIQITNGATPDDFLATVFVEWKGGSVTKTIQLSIRFYKWL